MDVEQIVFKLYSYMAIDMDQTYETLPVDINVILHVDITEIFTLNSPLPTVVFNCE